MKDAQSRDGEAGEQASSESTTFSPGPIGATCQYTAALRFVECTRVSDPVIHDHLARQLCGDAALELAVKELASLQADQGQGKHLRVPMRTRILEDWLLEELGALKAQSCSAMQVVSLGSGLDTRPWRLMFPPGEVHWICMDLPEVITMKQTLLGQAGAQTVPRARAPVGSRTAPSTATWPLKCTSWQGVGQDLSALNSSSGVDATAVLTAALEKTGFDPGMPTVWILEAVLYYMPLDKAESLLVSLASLSSALSTMIATCVDSELLEASRNLDAGHIFAQLWHFDSDELLQSKAYKRHWRVKKEPKTTKQIANDSYNVDTYVALYGGAEFAFVSSVAPPPSD